MSMICGMWLEKSDFGKWKVDVFRIHSVRRFAPPKQVYVNSDKLKNRILMSKYLVIFRSEISHYKNARLKWG